MRNLQEKRQQTDFLKTPENISHIGKLHIELV